MASPKACNVIAYIFAVLHALAIPLLSYNLYLGVDRYQLSQESDDVLVYVSGAMVTEMVIDLLSAVLVFIVSVVLIIGIKKERHQYIAPWVYLVGLAIFVSLFKLIWLRDNWIFSLIGTVIMVALWYPVFALYRDYLRPKNRQLPEHDPLNSGRQVNVQPASRM